MPSKGRTLATAGGLENVEFNGDFIKVPSKSQAEIDQLTPQPGQILFNSTFGKMVQSDGNGYIAIDSPPVISSVSAEFFAAVGDTIVLTGSNFSENLTLVMISNDNVSYNPASVVRNNSGSITITPGSALVSAGQQSGKDPFIIRVITNTGLVAEYSGLQYDPDPVWFTPADLGIYYDIERPDFPTYLSATSSDPDDTITYSLHSGTLPSGITSINADGTFNGSANQVGSDTTYNFGITATSSSGKSALRNFSVTIKAPVTLTYNYTGSDVAFTVPTQLSKLSTTMWGGAGGGANAEGYSDAGGAGGFSTAVLDVSEFTNLVIQVGSGGGRTNGSSGRPGRPYPAGGLPSVRDGYISGAGGGRSAIFADSVSHANSLVIAGGGGGAGGHGGSGGTAGENMGGGCGGGLTGESGWGINNRVEGGSQTAGGTMVGKSGQDGTPSGPLQGGDAGNGTLWSAGWNAAGGGGDGYYGGGAWEGDHAGGGGGSGYLHSSYVISGSTESNPQADGKKSTTNPAQTGNQYWSSGIAVGYANGNGGNGKVVITY